MQSHELKKPKHYKRKQRVGRGGKRGTFSGRGVKGQKARAGARIRPQIWDYILQTPKLKGTIKSGSGTMGRRRTPVAVVNLDSVNAVAKSGDTINAAYLVKKKLVRKQGGRMPRVKVLAKGDIKKKITVQGLQLSEAARHKIEAAGGEVKDTGKQVNN